LKSGEKTSFARSPFFYVGDKYKLLPQITQLFPKEFDRIIEPFVGGGSVFLNTAAPEVIVNDIDTNVIAIHKLLYSQSGKMEEFISKFTKLAKSYGLTCSYQGDEIPGEIRLNFPKTYFAQVNRPGFTQLKDKYNSSKERDVLELYTLMIYGFNRMLRFNKKGEYNIPVGNVDFNPNVVRALLSYSEMTVGRKVEYNNLEFEIFLDSIEFKPGDFLYVDPPYLITASEYNRSWNEDSEMRLYKTLDRLSAQGVRFALSNVEIYGERKNIILEKWMEKYYANVVNSNYINYFDNGKKTLKEVLVCNYEQA
jgi:DNA adenine methylase